MEKKTVSVHVIHQHTAKPIPGAVVHWSEHIIEPKEDGYIDLKNVPQKQITTNEDGYATIETEIQAYVKDAFNLQFKYLESVWIRIDFVECSGFKTCKLHNVFPPLGEQYENITGANHHDFEVQLEPETDS